jgi:ABC-type transport system involved in Fe-S cluster assembly fused permease/ATPase subunit
MKTKISVKKAIKIGKIAVNAPIIVVFLISCLISENLMSKSLWLFPVSILAIFILPWLYWSFAITKWRIWAFSNVDDICKLASEAVINKLIWEQDSIFEKTEIRTKKEQLIIKQINEQLADCNKRKTRKRKDKQFD